MINKFNTYQKTTFVVNNFIDEQEMNSLNKWCLANYQKPFFKDANMGKPGTRMTTRFSFQEDGLRFPEEAYKIKKKIIKTLGIENYRQPGFYDGIVCGIGFNEGSIFSHRDPVWHPGTYTFHCNIISNKPQSGGNTYVNDKLIPVNEGDLLCFDVSGQDHMVDEISGEIPRILWVFGFSLPEAY